MTTDAEWKAWRRAGITASDIACAISGQYGGAYAVVADKLGLLPDREATEDQDRGHSWEGPIADAVAVLHNLYVAGEQAWVEHPEHPRYRATVDGFLSYVEEPTVDDLVAGLEIKTRRAGLGSPWLYWGTQVQWQMWVTGMPRTLVAGLTIDHDGTPRGLQFRWIDADPHEQLGLVEVAEWLLAHVERGVLPDPQDASALETVKAVHSTADPDAEPVDLADIETQVARYAELRGAIGRAETEADELAALIRHRVGSAIEGRAGALKVTVRAPQKKVTDAGEARALADHPEWGRLRLDRDLVKPAKLLDPYRSPVGPRTLHVVTEGDR